MSYPADPEKKARAKALRAEYYQRNKEQEKANALRWHQANPEKNRAKVRKCRAKQAAIAIVK
jgi:hypothetical protein